MKLTCNSTLLSAMSVEDAIGTLAGAGYQGIDISAQLAPPFFPTPKPHLTPDVDAAKRRAVRHCAAEAGIEIVAVNAHNNLIQTDPRKRREDLEYVLGVLRLASDLGASFVVIGGGRKDLYGYDRDFFGRLVDALRELLPEASSLGVTLAVEVSSQPGVLLHGVSRAQRLLSHDGLESLGILFDTAHFAIRGEDVPQAFRALSHRVVHIHVKDSKGHPEDYECPPLGMGDIDFKAFLATLQATGYSGYLGLEDESPGWGYQVDPRQALADAKALLESVGAES